MLFLHHSYMLLMYSLQLSRDVQFTVEYYILELLVSLGGNKVKTV